MKLVTAQAFFDELTKIARDGAEVVPLTSPSQIAEASQLEKSVLGATPPRRKQQELFGIYENGKLVAMTRLRPNPRLNGADRAFKPLFEATHGPMAAISATTVHPEYRGRGYARALREHAQARYAGLWTGMGPKSDRETMRHLNESQGFRKVTEQGKNSQWYWHREKQAQALGIPDRSTSHELPKIEQPTVWQYAVHDHEARRRGRHFDLRLGDPVSGRAHSWALPPRLPGPGEAAWAIQQPTHTVEYMDFEGEIPEGYGAGKVGLHRRSQAEILEARPGHSVFQIHTSRGTEEYVLHRIDGKKWKLFNRTPTQEKLKLPLGKPPYKEIPPSKVNVHDDSQVMSAKIDDAHNLFVLGEAGKPMRIFSYRPAKKNPTGLIEHTPKVEAAHRQETPTGLGGTILRGGLYGFDPKTGKPIEAHDLGGLLNSDVWKSREKQKQLGKLIPVLYDVDRFRGRDVSKAPYAEKLKILEHVVSKLPSFHLPPMARTAKEKQELLDAIRSDRHPLTNEGVVLQSLHEYRPPVKAKFREEQDVFVRDFFPAEKGSKYEGNAVGGFTFSHTQDGPIAGRVGTGLSDALRRAMHREPERFRGATAVVSGARLAAGGARHAGGAIRSPSFKHFHPDKNPERDLEP